MKELRSEETEKVGLPYSSLWISAYYCTTDQCPISVVERDNKLPGNCTVEMLLQVNEINLRMKQKFSKIYQMILADLSG